MFNLFARKGPGQKHDENIGVPEIGGVKVVIGIGNPGGRYENTYHNAGDIFVDWLIGGNGTKAKKSAKGFRYADLGGKIAAKSEAFMNASGPEVKKIMSYFDAGPGNIAVAHDDSDLPIGSYKLSFGRGSAGHKGIESIIRTVGTDKFWRIRIGVRSRAGKAGDFVLSRISADDRAAMENVFREIAEEFGAKAPSSGS